MTSAGPYLPVVQGVFLAMSRPGRSSESPPQRRGVGAPGDRPRGDGVPPGGAGDQGARNRGSSTAAALTRKLIPQQGAFLAVADTEIATGLSWELELLDPLHHVVGHDPRGPDHPRAGGEEDWGSFLRAAVYFGPIPSPTGSSTTFSPVTRR